MREVPKRIHITRSTKHFDGDAVYATRYSSGIIHPIPPISILRASRDEKWIPAGRALGKGREMALNPQLFANGMPVPFVGEMFVLARDGVEFEIDKIAGSVPILAIPPSSFLICLFVCFNLFLIISFIFSFRSCGR